MNKQQKIVEMAKDICRVKHICNDVCKPISACDALRYAERAVEAGYSKQSEIARKIIDEVEILVNKHYNEYGYTILDFEQDIAELKKKYTEGQTNDRPQIHE